MCGDTLDEYPQGSRLEYRGRPKIRTFSRYSLTASDHLLAKRLVSFRQSMGFSVNSAFFLKNHLSLSQKF